MIYNTALSLLSKLTLRKLTWGQRERGAIFNKCQIYIHFRKCPLQELVPALVDVFLRSGVVRKDNMVLDRLSEL